MTRRMMPLALLILALPALPSPAAEDAPRLTAPVERGELAIEVESTGLFKAEDKTEISVEPEEYSGSLIVTKIVPSGETVKEGDLLIKFDRQELKKAAAKAEDAVTDARLKLDRARAALEAKRIEEESSLGKARKEQELAERKLKNHAALAGMKLEQKRQSVRGAEHALADAKVNLQQLEGMYQHRQLHTDTEAILLERERRGIQDQEKGLERVRQELAQLETHEIPTEHDELELALAQKRSETRKLEVQSQVNLAEKQADVTKAEGALRQAEEAVAGLLRDQEKLSVKSPRAGIVFYGTVGNDNPLGMVIMQQSMQSLRVGGRVMTHQVLLTVASMERLSVVMKVMENDIQHLKPGLPVTIRPDAFPDLQIPGKLTEVSQVATQGQIFSDVRQFTVKAAYEGAFGQLRAGMNCRVTVSADKVPDAVQVPVLAVFEASGSHFCYVQEGGKPARREVKPGMTNGKKVQILEGLKAGETVYLYDPLRE